MPSAYRKRPMRAGGMQASRASFVCEAGTLRACDTKALDSIPASYSPVCHMQEELCAQQALRHLRPVGKGAAPVTKAEACRQAPLTPCPLPQARRTRFFCTRCSTTSTRACSTTRRTPSSRRSSSTTVRWCSRPSWASASASSRRHHRRRSPRPSPPCSRRWP